MNNRMQGDSRSLQTRCVRMPKSPAWGEIVNNRIQVST